MRIGFDDVVIRSTAQGDDAIDNAIHVAGAQILSFKSLLVFVGFIRVRVEVWPKLGLVGGNRPCNSGRVGSRQTFRRW